MKIKAGLEADYDAYKKINAGDPYSARVVSYGEDWAKLMEEQIADGYAVANCAEATSRQADTDGIAGYMYGAAVSGLSKFWEHGDDLRAWHNRKYLTEEKAAGADESGGVVNPAVLTIRLIPPWPRLEARSHKHDCR